MTTDEQQNALIARLDEKINGLEKNINQKLDQILVQTTKTNGRLTKAEDDLNKLFTWKSNLKAIYTFIGVVGSVLMIALNFILK